MPVLPSSNPRTGRGFPRERTPFIPFKGFAVACAAALIGGSLFATPAFATDELPLPAASGLQVPPAAQTPPVGAQSGKGKLPTDQFIVKFKATTAPDANAHSKTFGPAAAKLGVAAADLRSTTDGARVVKTQRKLAENEAEQFLATVRADPNVEYAEPDVIMRRADLTPNDTYYPLQWDLHDAPGGLRMPAAWSVNRGAGVVVAVVDSGITNHSDLNPNVLPGYDMISDPAVARDGNGRDPDATDEGD
ncbi:hypothetical protein AB6813_00075 [bacterium RCC_150]